jgi:hypothetical protein
LRAQQFLDAAKTVFGEAVFDGECAPAPTGHRNVAECRQKAARFIDALETVCREAQFPMLHQSRLRTIAGLSGCAVFPAETTLTCVRDH